MPEKTTAERRLDALIDQLPVGVLFRDTQGRCTESNQKACDILGVACPDLVGTTADELFELLRAAKPDGTPLGSGESPALVATRTKRPAEPVELLITTPAGEVRPIVVRAAPVTLGGEEPFGSVVVVTDVTESRTLQQQLQQAQRMESIGVLAGGVAHDFNNILTAILGQTQLALRGLRPEDNLHPRLVEIERAAGRAAELTRQLLAFGRRQRLERKVIDLNGVINNMARLHGDPGEGRRGGGRNV